MAVCARALVPIFPNKKRLLQHIPIQRAGNADEVAQTILFLASEKASYVTGQSYAVDGGRLAA
jgi:NAD(P)-dependent dehydrogenase (short-subunit alcohol dehydrogenase family)